MGNGNALSILTCARCGPLTSSTGTSHGCARASCGWRTSLTWTWSGWVYVAFVFDAHSRRIIGWRAATSMTTPLVLDCLDMALWTRRREGVTGFAGLTHHTDAGSVYTSIAFTDQLVDEGVDPSVGSVGDAYDNSLAESQIGLYKSELIHHEGPWRDVEQVEARNRVLGAVVQHRPHPRLHRRPHTPSRSSNSTTLASNRSNDPADTSKTLSGHAGASHSTQRVSSTRRANDTSHEIPPAERDAPTDFVRLRHFS